ncbi:MAG TPA: efflux RND transporter periplasmic adaptor subunit [Alphaproteobacteria bacterium]
MIDFHAFDARARPIRIALKLALALVPIAVVFGAVPFLTLKHGKAAPTPAAATTPAVPVTAGPAVARDLPIWFVGVGSVTPLNVVNVKVRVDGQLDRVAFTEGQDVHAGDLLAQIDPRPFAAQLKQARANLAKDQATLANARVDHARFTKLASMGAAPSQNVDTLKAQVAALEATVNADQALIDNAQLQLDFTTLTSPLDGRVGLRLIDPGSIVHQTDMNGLVTVTQMQPISVIFTLPQDSLPDVLAASSAGKLIVDAYTRDGTKGLARGELVFIDSQVDPASGQFKLKARFQNPDRALWPGEFVMARILVRTEANITVVPARAVLRGQNGTYVYAVKPDKTVEVRPVTTGVTVEGVTAVLSGLAAGDTVVVSGQARLTAGVKVEVTPADVAAASPGTAS